MQVTAAPRKPETDAAAARRRSPWSTYRVVLIVVAGLVASVVLHLQLTHDKALRDAETLLTALAVASEHHVGGSLAGIDTMLDELAATVRDGRQRDEHFSRDFAARLASFPEIRFIGIIGADGNLQPESWPPYRMSPDGINLAHRKYFIDQRDAVGPAAMLVGEPAYSFSTNERVMHLSRPVRDKAGRFAGVVFASVNPDVFGAFLASIQYDEVGIGSLISLSGHIAALAPDPNDQYGRDISGGELFRTWLPRSPMGVAHLAADQDGGDRLVAYRLMPEFSLIVTAGIPASRALAEWRRAAAAELALLALFGGMLLYWAHRIRRQEAILGQQQRFMEAAVEQRAAELEAARTLAENRAARLGWINEELKRLTLVTSHHLQEPLRAIVSCGQMVPRALAVCPPELSEAVGALTREGVALKARLGEFEKHVSALTSDMQKSEAAICRPVPPPRLALPEPPILRPVTRARVIAAIVIIVLLGGNAWHLHDDYHTSIHSAETLTNAVVRSIERHLQASFRRVDALLADTTSAVAQGRHTTTDFRDRLASRMETMPEISQIAVVDAAGKSTQWSWAADGVPPYPQDVSTRDFFLAQKAAPQSGQLVVGHPQPERADDARTISFSHPVLGADGRFHGVVVAAVDADFYARFLEALLLDESGGSAVITRDGHIVARAPKHEEKFGIDISASDLFTRYLPQGPAGIAHLVSKADGNPKLLGYRVIDGFPLVVTSGYSIARALGPWETVAMMASALAAISSTILFAWAWRADRHSLALTRYRHWLAAEVELRTAGLAAAHDAVEQRSARLDEANGQMRDLIRMIAAEMQAPLRVLTERIAAVQQLAGGKSDEADHWLGFITAGGVHLRALLRDYQRFVAALSDSPRLRPLDSGEVIRGAAGLIAGMWGDRVCFEIGPLPRLLADRDMLLELFLQLFANAVIHSKRPVTVTVTAEQQQDGWCLTVSDDGPGLPAVNGEQLFRAFETAHDRDPDSTGLGLPLCRVIVQWHGGRIWATSRVGKGCDIHFVLPDADSDRFPLAGNSARA